MKEGIMRFRTFFLLSVFCFSSMTQASDDHRPTRKNFSSFKAQAEFIDQLTRHPMIQGYEMAQNIESKFDLNEFPNASSGVFRSLGLTGTFGGAIGKKQSLANYIDTHLAQILSGDASQLTSISCFINENLSCSFFLQDSDGLNVFSVFVESKHKKDTYEVIGDPTIEISLKHEGK